MSPEIKDLVDQLKAAIIAEGGEVGQIVVCNYEAKRTTAAVVPVLLGEVITDLMMATKKY